MKTKWIASLLILSLFVLAALYYGRANRANPIEADSTPDNGAQEIANSEETEAENHDRSFVLERSPDVPELPFDDNPDPTACGIPIAWGDANNTAYLTGIYEGELIQPIVFLYDSHSRLSIRAEAAHGTQVIIILYQSNPVLDYYLVRIPGAPSGENEGWIPAPFLSFDPV